MDKPASYRFEASSASVQYTIERDRPRLFVMVLDEYGFQREMSVELKNRPGLTETFWECSVYMHPGRRWYQEASPSMAKRFIKKFLDLCENHPDLLFNKSEVGRPRCKGFVLLAERLHLKAALNSNLI